MPNDQGLDDWATPEELATKQRALPLTGGLNAGDSIFAQRSPVMRLFETATQALQQHVGGEGERMATRMEDDLTKHDRKVTPDEITTFVDAVQSTGRYDLVPKVENALRAFESTRGLQVGESSGAMAAQFRALAAGGVDPVSPKWMRGIGGRPYILSADQINAARSRVPDAFVGK
jgi:hypothetical protein